MANQTLVNAAVQLQSLELTTTLGIIEARAARKIRRPSEIMQMEETKAKISPGGEAWQGGNPTRVSMAKILIIRFELGMIGHRFSRPLTQDEGKTLREIIKRHGGWWFLDKNNAEIGAWLCTCEQECELLLIAFAAEARVSIFALRAGEKSYVLTDQGVDIRPDITVRYVPHRELLLLGPEESND